MIEYLYFTSWRNPDARNIYALLARCINHAMYSGCRRIRAAAFVCGLLHKPNHIINGRLAILFTKWVLATTFDCNLLQGTLGEHGRSLSELLARS